MELTKLDNIEKLQHLLRIDETSLEKEFRLVS